ncbi:MAG: carbon monoxide dehydrogenase [Pusillimonas sp.]|nr:carbon monoxide dehydrogenase [Pusillimonas sp.]MBC43000.1 carbon monoxide dehydrogenase [Pusillimonas sp.]HCN71283.1 carbon monoxide dehydrogenase [Pusillimonas sp.]HCP78860.1 carbon monoxide dehydrogenase [Pusillimonas sp.]|tara:strand:+ start:786 stop:1247 length:462 start_codon:yes stop_codon:yes gene_type:complete
MEMSSERVVPAPVPTVWEALNNTEVLRECITGCDRLEELETGVYDVAMAVRVGPVNAKFKGRMLLLDVEAPTAYTIKFEGQGGIAGFAKGLAKVSLVPHADSEQTLLRYEVSAQIGGKLAQLGSRLVDSAAKKMADDFFEKFVASFSARPENA